MLSGPRASLVLVASGVLVIVVGTAPKERGQPCSALLTCHGRNTLGVLLEG